MINKIIEFWKHSYQSDKIAFYNELVSFVFTVAVSMYLAINADSPDLRWVYPGFMVGALTGCYAYWRRQIFWPMILTGYFVCVNLFGLGRAWGVW